MGHEKITGSDCYDSLQIRCPRLGGEVTFAYCRVEGGDIPCMRMIICWQNCLPITGFLQESLSADQLERFVQQKPRERIVTLVELIEAAKKECRD